MIESKVLDVLHDSVSLRSYTDTRFAQLHELIDEKHGRRDESIRNLQGRHDEFVKTVLHTIAGVEAHMRERDDTHDRAQRDLTENLRREISAAMLSAQQAVTKAEQASEKRFDGVNEFRATLADQQATLMPRAEHNVQYAGLSEKIDSVAHSVSTPPAAVAAHLAEAMALNAARLAALEKSVSSAEIRHQTIDPQVHELMNEVRALGRQQTMGAGKHEGMSDTVKVFVGGVALVATLLSILGATLALMPRTPPPAAAPPQVIYVPAPAGAMLPTTPPQAPPR